MENGDRALDLAENCGCGFRYIDGRGEKLTVAIRSSVAISTRQDLLVAQSKNSKVSHARFVHVWRGTLMLVAY